MKLLLYCTKAKPILYKTSAYFGNFFSFHTINGSKNFLDNFLSSIKGNVTELNGKIVAECDFEIERIEYGWYPRNIVPSWDKYFTYYRTSKIETKEFYEKSCLNWEQLNQYLNDYDSQVFEGGYAIHIKNLHIFDRPRELSFYFTEKSYNDINKTFTNEVEVDGKWYRAVDKAPQNMMKVWEDLENPRILISIKPEWLCKILNGEKTIEARKKVLKEMLK